MPGRMRHAPWWHALSGEMDETMRKSLLRHLGGSRTLGAPYLDTSMMRGILSPMTDACTSGASAGLSLITGFTFWHTTSCEPSAYELRASAGPEEREGKGAHEGEGEAEEQLLGVRAPVAPRVLHDLALLEVEQRLRTCERGRARRVVLVSMALVSARACVSAVPGLMIRRTCAAIQWAVSCTTPANRKYAAADASSGSSPSMASFSA